MVRENTDADSAYWEHHYKLLLCKRESRETNRIVHAQRSARQRIVRTEISRLESASVVAELGAGEGADLAALGDLDLDVLLAIDYSENACKTARENLEGIDSAHVVRADISYLPIRTGCISLAFSSGVLEHFEDKVTAIRETRRALSDSGIVVTFIPNKSSPWTFYRMARQILSRYFRDIPNWPVEEVSFSGRDIRRLMSAANFFTTECFGVHISYVLEPVQMVVTRIGGALWETRVGRVAWHLASMLEKSRTLANLLGMEICHVGKPYQDSPKAGGMVNRPSARSTGSHTGAESQS